MRIIVSTSDVHITFKFDAYEVQMDGADTLVECLSSTAFVSPLICFVKTLLANNLRSFFPHRKLLIAHTDK